MKIKLFRPDTNCLLSFLFCLSLSLSLLVYLLFLRFLTSSNRFHGPPVKGGLRGRSSIYLSSIPTACKRPGLERSLPGSYTRTCIPNLLPNKHGNCRMHACSAFFFSGRALTLSGVGIDGRRAKLKASANTKGFAQTRKSYPYPRLRVCDRIELAAVVSTIINHR